MTGSWLGTTRVIGSRVSIVQAVAVDMPRFSAIEAEVVTSSMIVFCESKMTIHRESCRGDVRGGCGVGSPIVVRLFFGVIIPAVPWLWVTFNRSCEAFLGGVWGRGMTTVCGSWLEQREGCRCRIPCSFSHEFALGVPEVLVVAGVVVLGSDIIV